MAIRKDGLVHVGIDNQAAVIGCNDITEHRIRRIEARLRNQSPPLTPTTPYTEHLRAEGRGPSSRMGTFGEAQKKR